MGTRKSSKIEPIHLIEAAALKALFAERNKLSQQDFGLKFDIGSQGMVWQYLNGSSALNLAAASKFATGLDCDIGDFSERLAQERDRILSGSTPGAVRVTQETLQTTDELIEALAKRLADKTPTELEYALASIKVLVERSQPKYTPEEIELRKSIFHESVKEMKEKLQPDPKYSPERKVSNGGQ